MSIHRDKAMELLKNYRSYRYAVSNGIAPHDPNESLDISIVSGYGPRAPRAFGERGNTINSTLDYKTYSRAVQMIEGAVRDVLDDDERIVIERKYLDRNRLTLSQIARDRHITERTVIRRHKSALNKLTHALIFVEVPEIINLDEIIKISG